MDGFDDHPTRQNVPVNGLNDVSEPLRGVVICCTSIPDEKRVSKPIFSQLRVNCLKEHGDMLTDIS